MPFQVACAQIAPAKGEISANLDKIAQCIVQAAGEGADLIIFPETATSGYFVEGGALECSLSDDELCSQLEARLKGLDRDVDIVLGFYQQRDGNLYNSAGYLEARGGKVRLLHSYQKFFLPTYGMFDEERFVSRGRDLGIIQTRFGKIGLLICEDVWHSILPTLCSIRGAQMIIVPAASPGRNFAGEQVGNHARYERLMKSISEEHGVYCVNCQLCGFEGGKGFVGGSMVFEPFGRVLAQGPINEEHILMAPIDLDLVRIARAQLPLVSDLQSAWGDIKRLVNES